MTNNDLERKISKAFKAATPDVLDEVLRDCEAKKGRIVMLNEQRNNSWVKRLVAVAAAVAIIITGALGLSTYMTNNAVSSIVSLDVNPSIEIKVNKNERVLEVVPLNEDGKKVIGDMDFAGSDIDVVVNALIGSMLREGYINDLANSILISVDGDDSGKSAELQARLTSEINSLLNTDSFSGAVLSQTVSHDNELEALASQYGITIGKAQLIRQIISQNTTYTFESLVDLSINELNLISGTSLDNVTATGEASDKKYIGALVAKKTALLHCGYFDEIGLTAEQVEAMTDGELEANISLFVKKLECELDYDNGRMVYEIDFEIGYYDYEYEIDAVTGTVLDYSKEFDNDNILFGEADKENTDTPSGTIDSTVVDSNSEFDQAYKFAVEFIEGYYGAGYLGEDFSFSKYIDDDELLDYTKTMAQLLSAVQTDVARSGFKLSYELVTDGSKRIDNEHILLQISAKAVYQYDELSTPSGFGEAWNIIVETDDKNFEIADWYLGKGSLDQSVRGIDAEFGDPDFWDKDRLYKAVLEEAHNRLDNIRNTTYSIVQGDSLYNGGEFYTDSDGRLNYISFKTMKSSPVCTVSGCDHESEATCPAFSIGTHPIVVDGSLYTFAPDSVSGTNTVVYKSNTDGTNKVKYDEFSGVFTAGMRALVGDGTLYFSPTVLGDGNVYLMKYDIRAKTLAVYDIPLGEHYNSSVTLIGEFRGSIYLRVLYTTDASATTPTAKYLSFEILTGVIREVTYPNVVTVGGGYLVHQNTLQATVVDSRGNETAIAGFDATDADIVNGIMFKHYVGGEGIAIDLSQMKSLRVKYTGRVIDFADTGYIVKNYVNGVPTYEKIAEKDMFEAVTPSKSDYITRQEAQDIALKHAGVNEADVFNFECSMDRDSGLVIYEVDFETKEYDYEYEINAETGAVIKYSKERDRNADFMEEVFYGDDNETDEHIGVYAASHIALDHAGVTEEQAKGLECEFDGGGLLEKDHYDVEFSANGYEYEYEINAENGKIIKSNKERDD